MVVHTADSPPTGEFADMPPWCQLLVTQLAQASITSGKHLPDSTIKMLRAVPRNFQDFDWAFGPPKQEVLRRIEASYPSAAEGESVLPVLVDDMTRASEAVEPQRLLERLTGTPSFHKYICARKALILRLVAAVGVHSDRARAEGHAARFLFEALSYEASRATGVHPTFERAFASVSSNTRPDDPSALLLAMDNAFAPATTLLAEQLMDNALVTQYDGGDLRSLPSSVLAQALANAATRYPNDPAKQSDEAQVRLQAWVQVLSRSDPQLKSALLPIVRLFENVSFLKEGPSHWSAQFALLEVEGGNLRNRLLDYIAKPKAGGSPQVNAAGQPQQPSQEALAAAAQAQQQADAQQMERAVQQQGVAAAAQMQQQVAALGKQQAAAAAASAKQQSALAVAHQQHIAQLQLQLQQQRLPGDHRAEPPPVVNAAALKQVAIHDMTCKDCIIRGNGFLKLDSTWMEKYGMPTQMSPELNMRPPLIVRAIAKELEWPLPDTFRDDVGLGGDACPACLLRGILRWYIHPSNAEFKGSEKPADKDCGYLHNIGKCRWLYAACHLACRRDVDAGREPRLWLFKPKPL